MGFPYVHVLCGRVWEGVLSSLSNVLYDLRYTYLGSRLFTPVRCSFEALKLARSIPTSGQAYDHIPNVITLKLLFGLLIFDLLQLSLFRIHKPQQNECVLYKLE